MKYKILLLFFLLWFGILTLTGSLYSGFHFTDDYEVVRLDRDLSHTTIGREARTFSKNLFSAKMRFRPLYVLHRRVNAIIFGSNFLALSVYTGLLAVFTSWFLFLFMRKTGFSLVESVLFGCLTLLGEQAAVWWKLGANETLGMFMLSIAMLFMAQGVYAEKRKTLYNLLFIFFTILATWSKESFILMIPALVFWQIWLTYQKGKIEADKHGPGLPMTFWRVVRGNINTAVVLLLVCAAELIHIVTKVGTTDIQYAGYEGFDLAKFIKTFMQLSVTAHGWVIFLQLAIIIFILLFRLKLRKIRLKYIFTSYHYWGAILFLLIVGPQIVLYMKSGIMERYLLPGIMGYTFLMILLLKSIGIHTVGKYVSLWNRFFPWDSPRSRTGVVVILVLAVITLQNLRVTRYTAIAFAHEGKHTNAWFQSIEQNTRESDLILVITEPVKYLEPSVSLKTYLNIEMKRRNIFFTGAKVKPSKSGFWWDLNKDFSYRFTEVEFAVVLVFPSLEQEFLNHSTHWFKPEGFKRYSNEAGFISYYKKETTKETKG